MALPKQPPHELPGPPEEGLFAPTAVGSRRAVVRRFGAFVDLTNPTAGRALRACIILGDDYGAERDMTTNELFWSPALLCSQTRKPFDRIVACCETRQASLTVAERVRRHVPEMDAVTVDISDVEALARIRKSPRPLLASLPCRSADCIVAARSLLPGFAPQRTTTVLLDAPISLDLLGMLLLHERSEVIATTRAEQPPAAVTTYLAKTLGLKVPPLNALTPFVASKTAFAASTAERVDAWTRLRTDEGLATDEFFLSPG